MSQLLSHEQQVEMQSQLRQALDRIERLERENAQLRGSLDTIFNNNAIWKKDAAGEYTDGPYCSGCWEGKSKLVHLVQFESGMPLMKSCPHCEAVVDFNDKKGSIVVGSSEL